jgi:cytochrome c-type biogenesis protein CcmH/NrfF
MPKGAVEEKAFIRDQLRQGLSVDQVIQLLDNKYGHRIS